MTLFSCHGAAGFDVTETNLGHLYLAIDEGDRVVREDGSEPRRTYGDDGDLRYDLAPYGELPPYGDPVDVAGAGATRPTWRWRFEVYTRDLLRVAGRPKLAVTLTASWPDLGASWRDAEWEARIELYGAGVPLIFNVVLPAYQWAPVTEAVRVIPGVRYRRRPREIVVYHVEGTGLMSLDGVEGYFAPGAYVREGDSFMTFNMALNDYDRVPEDVVACDPPGSGGDASARERYEREEVV